MVYFVAECEKNSLQEKVRTSHRLEEEVRCNLQQKIQQLESQISETQVLLDKETSKYRSACRQQEVSVTANTRSQLRTSTILPMNHYLSIIQIHLYRC